MTDSARVLVVDDQPDILELTETVLRGAGYRVATVPSGTAALEILADEPFDLVLLDINMPDIDGWETLRLLRADARLNDLTVVMFSVKGRVHDKVMSLQEGASDYITKPFDVDELLRRVARALDDRAERGLRRGDSS